MVENTASKIQSFQVSIPQGGSKCFDDNSRLERTGGFKVKICGAIQYMNLFGVAIGYKIAASISMMAIKRSNHFHESHAKNPCRISSNPYMIAFGTVEIIFSQIPYFDQISWLSIVAAVMSIIYSSIGLGLGVAEVADGIIKNWEIQGKSHWN